MGTQRMMTSALKNHPKKTFRFVSAFMFAALTLFSAPANAKEWAFDVYLDKSKIGQHVFSLNNNVLTSKAKFKVNILFIDAYQYDHQANEQWQDNCLTRLTSDTVENKVVSHVKANLRGSNLTVEDAKRTQNLPACTMTFAYWNPKILSQTKLLNPQNAEWLDTKISKLGTDTIVVKGKQIEAERYQIDGTLEGKNKLKIELWYSTNNEWLALRSTTPEGYIINYKLR
jgi:hypothetical protein